MPVDINMEMSGSRANICIYKACRLPIIQRRENHRNAKMHVYIFSDVHQESIDPRTRWGILQYIWKFKEC